MHSKLNDGKSVVAERFIRTLKNKIYKYTTIEFTFTLKCVCDMIITYSQMHCTDKYSQHTAQSFDQFG